MAITALVLVAGLATGLAASGALSGRKKTGKGVPNEDDPAALSSRAAEIARRRRGRAPTTIVQPGNEPPSNVGRPTIVGAGADVS